MRTRFHYGWVVVGVTALALLVAAGVRSAPGVLIKPLEDDFGWGRAAISLAASIGLLLFGLAGPVTGAVMGRFGTRRILVAGLVIAAGSTALGATMGSLWQLTVYWGIFGGIGTGLAGTVIGAAVATRWFVEKRGLVIGIFGAATSAGQLIFVPLLMWVVTTFDWRAAAWMLAIAAGALVPLALLLMRDDPASVGAEPYGGPAPKSDGSTGGTWEAMGRAVRAPDFWLLAGSFFVCGATLNGIIGTHFIAHSLDHGIAEATAAGTLALMGAMNFIGTLTSGWLTDRRDPRRLLAIYYVFRGASLILLPFVAGYPGLAVFAILFGLDYIATVPPTVALTADLFGRRHVAAVYGWIFFAHQVGAALAAYLGGVAREWLGDYNAAFFAAGALAALGGLLAYRIDRSAGRLTTAPAAAGA